MAEVEAVRLAVQMAIGNGWKKICIESNSKVVLEEIKRKEMESRRWDIDAIIQDIISNVALFDVCSFNWIRRSCNAVADWLAKNTLYNKCPSTWILNPDPCIAELLSKYE